MNIGEIGDTFATTKQVNYLSNDTLFEHDALIVDYDHLLMNSGNASYRDLFQKRKLQLNEFIRIKKIPIIYTTPKQRLIPIQVGGGGYNNLTPVPEFNVIAETGHQIFVKEKTIFTDFIRKYSRHFYYESYLNTEMPNVLAVTAHTNKCISFYDDNCIFLPRLKKTVKEDEEEFLKELYDLAVAVSNPLHEESLAEWTTTYFLPTEKELSETIDSTKVKILHLNDELKLNEKLKSQIESKKRLFTESGAVLENYVKEIFLELGVEILEAEMNRDDLIIKYKERVAVVEIKGVTKSAAEKHAAQLEKWVSNYFETHEVMPKGILLVNAFKDTPLHERTELPFPKQMLKYCTQREHCLMTTLDLLSVYFMVKNEGADKDSLLDSMFDTIGIYQPIKTWSEFIKTSGVAHGEE